MATLVIRNVPDDVKARLQKRAGEHQRSMEAELRDIIAVAVPPEADPFDDWWASMQSVAGDDFDIPERNDFGQSPVSFD